jgi:hypothetical protein
MAGERSFRLFGNLGARLLNLELRKTDLLESELGRGVTFFFTVPRAEPAPVAAEPQQLH